MKSKLLFKTILFFVSMAFVSLIHAQTPKSVCQIGQAPRNNDHVLTPGTVSSLSGDDFYITDGGCTIKCDPNDNVPTPIVGSQILVYGFVEVDDDDDDPQLTDGDIELEVYSWTKDGGSEPKPPTATISTVDSAKVAVDGTIADLSGTVTSWTDESDGEGIFADGTGSINIEFDGVNPNLNEELIVLGRVTTDDGAKEIDVYYWYPKDGTAPELPANVSYTIPNAKTAPLGSYAYLTGVLSEWIQVNDEGLLTKDSQSIQIDFDNEYNPPSVDDEITVLGILDDDLGTREVEIYYWVHLEATSIIKIAANSVTTYPNPAQDYLRIKSEELYSNVKLISLDGKVVLEQSARNEEIIHLKNVSSGNYILIISNRDETVGVKQIIVK